MMVIVWLLVSSYVHVLCPDFSFAASSTGFFSSSSYFTSATTGIRLLKDSTFCMQGCTGCLYWKMALFFRIGTRLLDWRQTQACVYVRFWSLGQNQDYLLDLNTCSFACLVLEKDVEVSRLQNVSNFWEVPVEAFGPVPEILYGDFRGRLCDLTAFES